MAQRIVNAFREFDRDGDNIITRAELVAILTRQTASGTAFSVEDANKFFNYMDTNGDGVIDYREFANACAEGLQDALVGAAEASGMDQLASSLEATSISDPRRRNRFVGESKDIDYPKNAINIPKCLQNDFVIKKKPQQECSDHGIGIYENDIIQGSMQLTMLRVYTRETNGLSKNDQMYNQVNASLTAYKHVQWENTIHYMNRGIRENAVPPKLHTKLYRGIEQSGGKTFKPKVGDTIVLKAFSSTSKVRRVAQNFAAGGIMLEFNTWKVGADLSRISHFGEDEAEVLLAPYQHFKVTKIRDNGMTIELDAK